MPISEPLPVLYVEDEALLREFIAVMLDDARFEVVTAENGAAAFLALNEGEPFPPVVTDVNLGDGPDGWAVAKRRRDLNRSLPVVYVTGASGDQWQFEEVPHRLLVKKPFKGDQILKAIFSLLQIGGPAPSTL